MIRAALVCMIAAALTGCRGAAPICPREPVVLEVPIPVREPIPAELTERMDESACEREGPTVGDVRRQRAAACAALRAGNARLDALRELRPR
jgi:hypothetical protein